MIERCFSFKIKNNNENKRSFLIVVPSAVFKGAVVRNKIKRRARAIFRKHPEAIKNGVTATFYFKKGAEKVKFLNLEEEVTNALKNK